MHECKPESSRSNPFGALGIVTGMVRLRVRIYYCLQYKHPQGYSTLYRPQVLPIQLAMYSYSIEPSTSW